MGYIYRYWHFYTGESSKEIYKQAKVETMRAMFLHYHTMSPEMAIDRLKETYLNKKKNKRKSSKSLIEKYEFGLPDYLQHDLDELKKGIRENSSVLDCIMDELESSINMAEITDKAITHEHAEYLRKKFL